MHATKASLMVKQQCLQYTDKISGGIYISYFIRRQSRRSLQESNTVVWNHGEYESLERSKQTFLFVQSN